LPKKEIPPEDNSQRLYPNIVDRVLWENIYHASQVEGDNSERKFPTRPLESTREFKKWPRLILGAQGLRFVALEI